jgi:phosphoglycerate dehydrogenase-like enzyme
VLKGLYLLSSGAYDVIYSPSDREEIARLVDIYTPPRTAESVKADPSVLKQAEAILSGWGAPRMDEELLAAAPNLRAVFYAAGSIRGVVTEAFWRRGIVITSAYAANAVPVAEYTLSQILFCLKFGWRFVAAYKQARKWSKRPDPPGAYGSTVGIISLGMIGRLVCKLLRPFDVKVLAFDPYVDASVAGELNVELCSLDDVFRRSDVVSLHTPNLPETQGMVTGAHFDMMKPGAAFINTARGAIVRESEMIEALRRRIDLQAVLDVTHPEPPVPDSPLYDLPNVVLTPHIAGSMAGECRRMGRYMLEELRRYLSGQPLQWAIDREKAARLA